MYAYSPITSLIFSLFILTKLSECQLRSSPIECATELEGQLIKTDEYINKDQLPPLADCIRCQCIKNQVECKTICDISLPSPAKRVRAISTTTSRTTTTTTTARPTTTTRVISTATPVETTTEFNPIVWINGRQVWTKDPNPIWTTSATTEMDDYEEFRTDSSVAVDFEDVKSVNREKLNDDSIERPEEEEQAEAEPQSVATKITTTTTEAPIIISTSTTTTTTMRPSSISNASRTRLDKSQLSTTTTTPSPTVSSQSPQSVPTTTFAPSPTSTTIKSIKKNESKKAISKVIKKEHVKLRKSFEPRSQEVLASEVEATEWSKMDDLIFVIVFIFALIAAFTLFCYMMILFVSLIDSARKATKKTTAVQTPARAMLEKYYFEV